MKIVHINFLDHYGGAAIAARRLHQAMQRAGHDSRMLVWRKFSDDPTIDLTTRSSLRRGLSRMVGRRLDEWGWQYVFHPASTHLTRHPWIRNADIIHLHQVHGSYLALSVLASLAKLAPLFWTMHDMWAVTGHCAVAAYYRCDRWQIGCGQCPYLDATPAVRHDFTHRNWQRKRHLYDQMHMDIIAPSQWLANRLRQSPLLQAFPIYTIANGVDTNIFRPIDKAAAREALGLPTVKKVVMFGAASLQEQEKGGHVLVAALKQLPVSLRQDMEILLVGSRHSAIAAALADFELRALGPVQNEALLAIAYAAADLFVLPSLAENLPNMLIESQACGTPCVAFDVGGCSEIIQHNHGGYLAKAGDVDDLARGIVTLLMSNELRRHMADAGIKKVQEIFDVDRQAGDYLLQYERVVTQAFP